MIRIPTTALALLLLGCSGEASQAERAYEIASKADNPDDACRAARAAAAAHLKNGSEEAYRDWSRRSTVVCFNAEAARARGEVRF